MSLSRIRYVLKAAEAFLRLYLRDPLSARWRAWRFRRLPTAMITGTAGKTTTARLLAAILQADGRVVGAATTDDVRIGGATIATGDFAGFQGHRLVLNDRRVQAAVLETARGGLARRGLYLPRVSVAALINVWTDHLGQDGVDTIDAMAALKSRVTDAARDAVVLNADDARCLALAGRYDPRRVILFSARDDSPAIVAHLSAGGRAVAADARGVMRALGPAAAAADIAPVAAIPVTHNGRAAAYAADAMAAAGLAIGLGAPLAAIAAGLKGFAGGRADHPARLTVFDGLPFRLVVDRTTNALGLAAVAAILKAEPTAGRRIVALSAAGNRRDAHYGEAAAAVADAFDHFLVFERERFRRGRPHGVVARLLADGLAAAGVRPGAIETVAEDELLARVAERAHPGDLVVLTGMLPDDLDTIEKAVAPLRG